MIEQNAAQSAWRRTTVFTTGPRVWSGIRWCPSTKPHFVLHAAVWIGYLMTDEGEIPVVTRSRETARIGLGPAGAL